MFNRALTSIAFSKDFGRQMRFIAGPRQVGKTTLAKSYIQHLKGFYYNWDARLIRNKFHENNHFFHDDILAQSLPKKLKWICFDEIHKMPKWKNILKDIFDTFEDRYRFIITGSARLELFRKSGDSLAGRYFNFRLNPLSLSEINSSYRESTPPEQANDYITQCIDQPIYHQTDMENILKLSGFPEPLSQGNLKFKTKWNRDYLDRLISEDLRDLTKISNLENTAFLLKLLPRTIGSPLSANSLSRDLQISYKAVQNLLQALDLMYITFKIRPWHLKVKRAIQKAAKIYFYDCTLAGALPKIFENFVALEWKSRIDRWMDKGEKEFELFFIKTQDGLESDFLITRDRKPWLLCEAKISSGKIDTHHTYLSNQLGNIPIVQIVLETNITSELKNQTYQISASRFFRH